MIRGQRGPQAARSAIGSEDPVYTYGIPVRTDYAAYGARKNTHTVHLMAELSSLGIQYTLKRDDKYAGLVLTTLPLPQHVISSHQLTLIESASETAKDSKPMESGTSKDALAGTTHATGHAKDTVAATSSNNLTPEPLRFDKTSATSNLEKQKQPSDGVSFVDDYYSDEDSEHQSSKDIAPDLLDGSVHFTSYHLPIDFVSARRRNENDSLSQIAHLSSTTDSFGSELSEDCKAALGDDLRRLRDLRLSLSERAYQGPMDEGYSYAAPIRDTAVVGSAGYSSRVERSAIRSSGSRSSSPIGYSGYAGLYDDYSITIATGNPADFPIRPQRPKRTFSWENGGGDESFASGAR